MDRVSEVHLWGGTRPRAMRGSLTPHCSTDRSPASCAGESFARRFGGIERPRRAHRRTAPSAHCFRLAAIIWMLIASILYVPRRDDVMFASDSATDLEVSFEYCSHCERQTDHWCPDCFGCAQCCPTGQHCEECGQSQQLCDRTCCGGTSVAPSRRERRIA